MRTALETGDYYWRDVLLAGGASTLPVSTCLGAADRLELTLETPDLPHTVARLADLAHVPAEAVLIAAHAKVLTVWCGGITAVLGVRAADTHAVLPLRVSTAGRTWRDLLHAAGNAYSDLMQHHTYPVALLRSDLGLHGPVFSTVLRLGSTLVEPEVGVALCLDVDAASPHRLHLSHRTDVLDAPDASRLGWDHVRALTAMTAGPDAVHDLADAPEIRLARPRSAAVSVR